MGELSLERMGLTERVIGRLKKLGIEVITIREGIYPDLLRQIPDPPEVLFAMGNLELLKSPCIAVVGTRKASPYGRAVAERLSQDLSEAGVTVVSGLAKGIDASSHWGALRGPGSTIAVLGSGIDVPYPPGNRELYKKISREGLVISPFPPGERPLRWNFPRRNRIIAGLSLGTVVVECPLKSGAMITARFSLDFGREVFAVPGNITNALSEGANYLIKEGAKPVTCAEDVLSEFPQLLNFAPEKDKAELTGMEKKVFELIKSGLQTEDELLRESGLSFSELSEVLLTLEMMDIIKRSAGKVYLAGGM